MDGTETCETAMRDDCNKGIEEESQVTRINGWRFFSNVFAIGEITGCGPVG